MNRHGGGEGSRDDFPHLSTSRFTYAFQGWSPRLHVWTRFEITAYRARCACSGERRILTSSILVVLVLLFQYVYDLSYIYSWPDSCPDGCPDDCPDDCLVPKVVPIVRMLDIHRSSFSSSSSSLFHTSPSVSSLICPRNYIYINIFTCRAGRRSSAPERGSKTKHIKHDVRALGN